MSSSVRVFVTGFRHSIRGLCDALAQQPEVELLGVAASVAEAAGTLATGDVDVVVHSTVPGARPQHEVAEVRELTRAPIVLLTEGGDPTLFEEALDADVADVVVLPQPPDRLAFTIRRAARSAARDARVADQGRARIATVFSPKGGTGKTVISSNLASSAAKHFGVRTLLLDLDLQFGDAAIMLGLEPEQTLHDLATAPGKLDAGKFGGYLTRHAASGLDVLAAPLRPEDGERVTHDKVERLIEVARDIYDLILVDTSPSFHGPMLSALDTTDVLLLVSTPEVPTLKNVRLGIETLRRLSFTDERMKLVLNRADAAAGLRKAEVEGALGMRVSYALPNSADVPAAVNEGTPLTLSLPNSPFALAVQDLSRSLIDLDKRGATGDDALADQSSRSGLVGTVRGLAGSFLPARADKSVPSAAEGPA